VLFAGFGIWLTMPNSVNRFLSDALILPFDLVAGAVVGAIYVWALMLISKWHER
jgi:hypothetical protein